MSYLDVPRLHFSGAYYVDVATRNNATMNYLDESQNLFNQLGNTTWNPNGQNVIYLRGCKIRSVVDSAGQPISSGDPLVGAPLESQGPYSNLASFGDVPTSNPKLSDYDPDQQYRSQINGMWLGVLFPGLDGNSAGFFGFLDPTNLRDLGTKVFPAYPGSYGAAGNYGARLTQLSWIGDPSNSPMLLQFKQAIDDSVGIAVRFILDLYQGSRQQPVGGDYGFGRIQGSFGPAYDWECKRLVPGRRLDSQPETLPTSATPAARCLHDNPDQPKPPAPTPAAAAAIPAAFWMPAFAQVRSAAGEPVLSLDLGPAVPAKGNLQGGYSDGSLCVDNFVVGYQSGAGFVPLGQGTLNLGAYQQVFSSSYKTFNYLRNSGIVDIPLTAAEAGAIAAAPLRIQTGAGDPILQEQAQGVYIDIDPPAIRMQQGETRTVQLQYLRFGQASSLPFPLNLQNFAVRWHGPYTPPEGSPYLAYRWQIEQPSDISFSIGSFDQHGIAAVTVTAPQGDLKLVGPRVDLASQINFVLDPNSPAGYPPTGTFQQPESYQEPATGLEFFTVLVWQTLQEPATLTWDDDIGPILQQFARLYPGMVSMLDIGDEQRVINNAAILIKVLSKLRNDPAYMPATRELSDARVAMVIKWLEAQT